MTVKTKMVKTSKSKVNKWFDDNYAKNLAKLDKFIDVVAELFIEENSI